MEKEMNLKNLQEVQRKIKLLIENGMIDEITGNIIFDKLQSNIEGITRHNENQFAKLLKK